MRRTRTHQALVLALVSALTLCGCSSLGSPSIPSSEAPTKTQSATPETHEGEGSSTPSANIAAPGATITIGQWASYAYTGAATTAVVAARLVSIDEVSPGQKDLLVTKLPELEDYTVWILLVEQQKVFGAPIAAGSDYAAFYPVDVNKKKVQYVTIVGWDECRSESFTKEFDDGATITQCIIGATKPGESDVAGVIYAPLNTPYDAHDGNPINFLK